MRFIAITIATALLTLPATADPLPSWASSHNKAKIIEFIEAVTDPTSELFVPTRDRIAVFDNDGTLWSEKPVPFQLLYAIDRLQEKAANDPSILTTDALKVAANGDMVALVKTGHKGLLEVAEATHTGMSVAAFQADVKDWLANATHPDTGLLYTSMTYQPMEELLLFLRDEGFSTYIVSGGGIDFIRALSDDAYGIPPWKVVGSEGTTEYQAADDGIPELMKIGGVSFVDDSEGKPVGIIRHIGQRPIFAAGNSDGDFQMLEWVTNGDGPSLGVLVHHTDADREFAYDRNASGGALDLGLDEAAKRGWVLVDMQRDWTRVWTNPSDN